MTQVPSFIHRRIAFLISEARTDDPVRDQTVTYAMRVISNFCAFGRDAGSAAIKKNHHRMSRGTFELKNRVSGTEWIKLTINEHQEPLKNI